jgi:histidine triad (HIT) family protein
MSACEFCEIINGKEPSYVIWEDKHFIAYFSVPPYNPGHVVIISKRHFESVFELREPLYSEFFQAAKNLYVPLKSVLKVKSVAVNFGTIGCNHCHINLYPANGEDMRPSHNPIDINEAALVEIVNRVRNEIEINRNPVIQ